MVTRARIRTNLWRLQTAWMPRAPMRPLGKPSQPCGRRATWKFCAASLSRREPASRNYLWAKTGLPTYNLTMLGDRMEMAHSIEGRVPFLDHHGVEVIRSQPVAQKIRGMTEKCVLREAVRDVVSDTVYRRQKHLFLSPPRHPESRGTPQYVRAGHASRRLFSPPCTSIRARS